MGLVRTVNQKVAMLTNISREHGEPSQSEFTVAKVDAYNGINAYLSELSCTRIKTVEDIIAYNSQNRGTEGACPNDHPAFPSGQVSDFKPTPSLSQLNSIGQPPRDCSITWN
jgi:hypothetical protein